MHVSRARSITGAIALILAAMTPALAVSAASPPAFPAQAVTRTAAIAHFSFADGRTQDLRLAYRTIGQPRRDRRGNIINAVLLIHGTGSSGEQFFAPKVAAALFASGAPLDPAKVWTIVPDTIGMGGSSKPSDGQGTQFPHYDYADMVRAEHHLVREVLGVSKLRVVLGTSMGGAHAWLWATEYPLAADTIIALATLPVRPTGRNLLWRIVARDALLADPTPGGPGARIAAGASILGLGADRLLKKAANDPAKGEALLAGFAQRAAQPLDLAWHIDAFRTYNPEPHLGRVVAKVVNVNFADDPGYPPELDPMRELAHRFPNIHSIVVPASERTSGHATLGDPEVWLPYVEQQMRSALGS